MFRYSSGLLVSCLMLSSLLVVPSTAQDAHRWDTQYGTKGSLLGGIVVGSSSDLSASFYNPGWIAHSDDPSFLMSTKAWEVSSTEVTEGIHTGTEPTSSYVGTSPGFMAWQIKTRAPEGWKMVFSYLNRIRFQYNTSVTRISENDLPDSGSDQWYVGEGYRHAKTDENWFGVTMARRINESFSGGVTLYGVYRSQRSRLEFSATRMGFDGAYSAGKALDEYKFWHGRMLAKIGFAYKGDPFSFGITLTTPSMGIMGSGEVYQQVGYSRTNDVAGAPTETFLTANAQANLDASWKSSLALAIGASWQLGNTRLHYSSEWFNAVSDQIIMEPDSYFSQSTGDIYEYQNSYNYRSIINFGFGIDHRIKESLAVYGSFRSDYSVISGEATGNYIMADWNIWHISSGASFEIIGMELTSGLQYSFGNGNTNRYLNLGSEISPTSIGEFGNSDVNYRHLKLMVGFDFTFGAH